MNNRISEKQFLAAFSDQWDKDLLERQQEIFEMYGSVSAKPWTNYMLGEGGFIDSVVARINPRLKRKPEWWRIDLVYIGDGRHDAETAGYDMELNLLIEHENGNFPEEEMYNLIFFRCPLKVIIFRDYNDSDRIEKKGGWLVDKLKSFKSMLDAANAFHSEDNSTRYFFIFWARNTDGLVYWRWASDQNLNPANWAGSAGMYPAAPK